MYKLIIFDFDGTLADSFGWFLDVFDTLADRFGFRRLERDRIEELRGLDSRDLLKHQHVALWKLPFIAAAARAEQHKTIDSIKLFDGMAEVLDELARRGVAVAVVTSNARANVERVLGPSTAHIRYWACRASLFGKAALFRRVLKQAGVQPHEALCVGDELRDIEAARAVGCAAGAVSWGYALPHRLAEAGPEHVFETTGDIVHAAVL